MELMKLSDRIIIEMRNDHRSPMDGYEIHQMLHTIGGKIYNGYSGGIENTDTHEVQWRHETEEYGGYRRAVVGEETMNDIRELLKDWDNEEENIRQDICLKFEYLEDAIQLLSKIVKENEQ